MKLKTLTAVNKNSHSLKEQIASLVNHKEGKSQNLVIPNVILKYTNYDLKTAALLSNLIYWTDQGKTGDELIERSPSEWYEETGLDRMDIHDGLETREVRGVLSTEGREPQNYAQLKLDKKALIKALHSFVNSNRNRIAYYKLEEGEEACDIEGPITYHELLCFSRFFDKKLKFAICTRLEMCPDYVAKNYKKRHSLDPHRFRVKFPLEKWIKICDAFSEMFNKAQGDSYMECIVNEHCADPHKYAYCKKCFKKYI